MKDLFGHSSLKGLEKEAWGTFSDIVREKIIGLVGTLLRGWGCGGTEHKCLTRATGGSQVQGLQLGLDGHHLRHKIPDL